MAVSTRASMGLMAAPLPRHIVDCRARLGSTQATAGPMLPVDEPFNKLALAEAPPPNLSPMAGAMLSRARASAGSCGAGLRAGHLIAGASLPEVAVVVGSCGTAP